MGLRCSLLGHDFGDPEVEREREERGSEVVLTVREVAACRRCSKTTVKSENKEVTTLHDGDHGDDPTAEASEIESVDADDSIVDADATSPSSEDDASDGEDDAVIMDDEDGSDGRAHGEWPEPKESVDEDDDRDDGPTAWPTIDSEDEGFDAQPSAGGDAAVEFEGGLAPERTTLEEEEGLEYVEATGPESGQPVSAGDVEEPASDEGFARAGAAPSPAEPATADVDTENVCPQCGFVDDAVGSSLRAGDVCPDCRKGYLAERDR